MKAKKKCLFTLMALLLVLSPLTATHAAEQFFPMLIYRTGPYAAGGTGFYGGLEDYYALLNKRDGGVGGVKLTWEECETAYNADRGVECYERLKNNGGGATIVQPMSTPITYRLIERATADKIPVMTMGYGRTDASDGRVFPYVFPIVTNYWSQNTAKIKYIALKEGGLDKLKGKKIAHLYHDSGYGKETIPILDLQALKYGFEVQHFPVPPPGLDQKATWLQIARLFKPDWVILRGWGVMNPTALKEAARVGFPANRIVGVWWSGAEEDVIPAGSAAVGFVAAGFHPSGSDFPVIREILDVVYGAGEGNISPQRVGTIYYNRGIIAGIITVEAMRLAQKKFGPGKRITGEQMRWGMENLNIKADAIKALGAEGLMSPIKVSCFDHEGGGAVKFQEWDGKKWNIVTDWIETDQSIVRPLIESSAAAYALEKGISVRGGKGADPYGSNCGGK
ncbi:MAG: ABC transporter substrate-binding protein [Smithellaceae bacterium]|nr:ABC transporter substrate-binding protein [Smithellaceae bacterium]